MFKNEKLLLRSRHQKLKESFTGLYICATPCDHIKGCDHAKPHEACIGRCDYTCAYANTVCVPYPIQLAKPNIPRKVSKNSSSYFKYPCGCKCFIGDREEWEHCTDHQFVIYAHAWITGTTSFISDWGYWALRKQKDKELVEFAIAFVKRGIKRGNKSLQQIIEKNHQPDSVLLYSDTTLGQDEMDEKRAEGDKNRHCKDRDSSCFMNYGSTSHRKFIDQMESGGSNPTGPSAGYHWETCGRKGNVFVLTVKNNE